MGDNNQVKEDVGLSAEAIDRINDAFYSRFNYPWLPLAIPTFADSKFHTCALNNDLGFFEKPLYPANLSIWVAGCGTNQAIFAALRFPEAEVLGSDVSTESLRTCERIAKDIGLTNLTLKQESLNSTTYKHAFDYVICTGVIHHNAKPAHALANIAQALRPDGTLELMVYNYFHRVQTTAFQRAIRLLSRSSMPAIDDELPLARELVEHFPVNCQMSEFLSAQRNLPESAVADSLLQPVEFSYTISTLRALLDSAGLRLAAYVPNQFDKLSGHLRWEMPLSGPSLGRAYDSLPDCDRWQITNLLLGEVSPMLWFHVRHKDAPTPTLSAAQTAEAFLSTVFSTTGTRQIHHVLREGGTYLRATHDLPYPAPIRPVEPIASAVFEMADGREPMSAIFSQLGLNHDLRTVEHLRTQLATSGFPYLKPARS